MSEKDVSPVARLLRKLLRLLGRGQPCPACRGTGGTGTLPCPECDGSGKL